MSDIKIEYQHLKIAAEHGHIKFLKHLHDQNKFQWNDNSKFWIFIGACNSNRVEILKWVTSDGVIDTSKTSVRYDVKREIRRICPGWEVHLI
jgi:hypothetical protein